MPRATSDLPRRVLPRVRNAIGDESTSATVELWISPKGKVLECEVLDFEGDEALAQKMCRVAVGGKVIPATDSDEQPIHALYTTTISAYPGSGGGSSRFPYSGVASLGLTIQVSELPSDLHYDPLYSYRIRVAADGSAVECYSTDRPESDWTLIGCEQIRAGVFPIKESAEREPVDYLRNVDVKFELAE